jgi:two-component system, chemotaxis family, response regulator Rcp1
MKPMPEVLLVDDNVADVLLASEALTVNSDSCHVSSVGDGAEAIAFLRHEGRYAEAASPDLVILDLNLPKKSGEAVLAELRSDPRLRNIPVVIFSSSRANKDIVRSYELGANCYLSKPGNLSEFASTVQLIGSFFGCCEAVSKGERWTDQKPTYC